MSNVSLRNINPLGAVDLPLIGRTLEAGEEFEVDAVLAEGLLQQVGNYELVAGRPDDLDALTVPDLRTYAADRGIDLAAATKKADIIAAINTHLAEKG